MSSPETGNHRGHGAGTEAQRTIAVVILNYNGKAHLEKFLPVVIQFSEGATIIVADNGSTDDSLDFIRKNYRTVRVIDNGRNLGFCGGYNTALKQIDAGYYVLLNNDVEVTAGWIAPMKRLLDERAGVGAVQPRVLSYHNRKIFEYAGAGGGFVDALAYPFCRGRLFDHLEEDSGQYSDTVPVFWATGACLAIRSRLFHELGGFDEDFFAHMEEIDLCWKLKRNGHEVYYAGESVVYHVGGGTLAVSNPRKTYYNFRNGLDMLIKHQRGGELLWKLPLRVILDWIAGLRFLAGSPGDAWAVLKAHFYILGHLGKIFRKRGALKRQLRGFAVSEAYGGILVYKYFVQGKKTYRELNNPK
jgi:GT2 family glycosyltransferase